MGVFYHLGFREITRELRFGGGGDQFLADLGGVVVALGIRDLEIENHAVTGKRILRFARENDGRNGKTVFLNDRGFALVPRAPGGGNHLGLFKFNSWHHQSF